MRYRLIAAAAVIGVFIVGFTELLSLGHLLTRTVAFFVWIPAIVALIAYVWRFVRINDARRRLDTLDRFDWTCITAIVGICVVNLFLALVAAPSAWDALSYHAPRISHWIQNRSVAHYPTHIDRQLWISPGHEFFALQLQLLTGTGRFMNTVQWMASIGCLATTSLIAKEHGASRKGQLLAALFSATIPMAVAQASGSQTDLFAAFWITASIALLLREMNRAGPVSISSACLVGACSGLAMLAKGTAFVVLAPFVVWAAISIGKRIGVRIVSPLLVALGLAVAINSGHAIRNYKLYGDPLTNPRNTPVINEAITPRIIASNIIRNATLHLYTRSTRANVMMQRAVERLHSTMGIDVSDPHSTFFITRYDIKARPRTEGRVGNHVHLLLLILAGLWVLWRRPNKALVIYFAALCGGYVLFCAILKWQPWNSRLQLPLFVAAAGMAGYVFESAIKQRARYVVATVLILSAMPILLRNAARPVVSRHAIWTMPREKRYFNETPGMYTQFAATADLLASRKCARVGLVTSWVDWEELLWVVMRQRSSQAVEIEHVFFVPDEPSKPAPTPRHQFEPCAIVSLFSSDFLKPGDLTIPPEWHLARRDRSIEVYFPN